MPKKVSVQVLTVTVINVMIEPFLLATPNIDQGMISIVILPACGKKLHLLEKVKVKVKVMGLI